MNMVRFRLLAVIGAVCLSAARPACALDPATSISQYSHTVWRAGDGLPDNFVQALLQTKDGYLWIGTAEGLVRFDGLQFTVFDTRNTPALRHNSVVALCELRNGALWVGTSGGGVTTYENGRFTGALTTSNGLPNNYVRSIYETRDGSVWITAHGGGLVKINDGRILTYTVKDGLPSDSLRLVYEDRRGTLWVGADEDGLCSFRNGRFRCYGRQNGLTSNQIRAMHEDRAGRLWVGTRAGGLLLFDGARFRLHRPPGHSSNLAVRTILEDRDGNLWIGTEGAGLYRMQKGRFDAFTAREGLPHSFVRSIAEDQDGNLWLGTRGGLCRLRDRQVETWTTSEGLLNDNVRAIFEDKDGVVWIGNTSGVNRLVKGRLLPVRLSPEWSRDVVRAIAQSRGGTIWIGADTGLFSWRGGHVRRFPGDLKGPPPRVRALLEDRQGRLWVGAEDGLFVVEGPGTVQYSRVAGLPPGSINAIAAGRGGSLWFGCEGGLAYYSGGTFRIYTSREGLPDNRVAAIHIDAGNVLWAATQGGLARMRDGKITAFTRRDGLLRDFVLSLVEDRHGHFWLSSRRGVSRIAKSDLEAFASGHIGELHPVSFDTADGMNSEECNGDSQPAGLMTRDGRIWFPTVQGVVVFDPASIRAKRAPPRVVVERVVAGAKAFPAQSGSLSLPPGTSDLEVQFTAISLSAPERVRFRYRLDGYDAGWIDTGRRRSAWYTNLSPGRYRFRVVAYSNDGSWPREESSLALDLKPRFYQTAWFSVLCGAALAGLALLAYRLRVIGIHRRYQAVLEERARIAREIHDTLMQGVTGISLQLEAASLKLPEDPAEAKGRLVRALERLDQVLAEARHCILELRAPIPPERELALPLRRLADELAGPRGMAVDVEVQGEPRPLPEKVRSHLLSIAREAITNSVLHSSASRLRLVLSFHPDEVRLLAADNGRGFDAGRLDDAHFGLLGMRERAAEIGAQLAIRSAPGNGAEISVAVPAAGRRGSAR
jgi:ligand-binding sensor domain-containing protein